MCNEFRLRVYQEKARDAIVNDCVEHLQSNPEQERVYGFVAPTGAGKTAIVAKAIKEISAQLGGKVAFLWNTISSGNLDDQSYLALKKHLNRSGVNVLTIQEALTTCLDNMAGNVVVIGWSAINDEKNGEPSNIVMRANERNANLPAMCANTRDAGIPIVLILDEAHTHANTQRAKQIRDRYIQPLYVLEVSATPINTVWHGSYKSAKNNTPYPGITFREVADAHMVKKDIYAQTFLHYKDGVRGASFKLIELIELAKACGAQFIPKMLIFIPNKNNGSVEVEDITALLKSEFGWTVDNGDVKLVLADDKTENWENCKVDNMDTTKVLITKEAIGTGVDIPSISMIVQLRPTKSTRVEVQKLGRGLRMPEQKHYGNDLDTLFFCVFNDHILDFNGAEYLKQVFTHECTIKPEYNDLVSSFEPIETMYYERTQSFIDVEEEEFEDGFYPFFLSALKERAFDYFDMSDKHDETLKAGEVDLDMRDFKQDIGYCTNVDGESIDIIYQTKMRATFKHLFKYRSIIENAVSEFLNLDIDVELIVVRIKTFILNNLDKIKAFVYESVKKAEDVLDLKREEVLFTYTIPPKYEFVGEKEEKTTFKNVLYTRYFLDSEKQRSSMEGKFEPYIDGRAGGWWKNYASKNGKSLSIPYCRADGKQANFYPDWMGWTRSGKWFILETKPESDREYTAKRDALVKFFAKYPNVIAGIVVLDHDTFYLDRGEVNKPQLNDLLN
jgi:type III restriction enzyme